MNTEELYIWNYGIGKLPKGLLEFGRSDVCDTYDESKRQKFQNHGQWMWKNKDGWRENLPHVLYLVCNKKPGILQFDFLDKYSIKLKIVSEEFLSLLQENGFVDKYDIATVKVVNKKNESLTDKKYYALRINHYDNDSFHFGKGITYQSDFQKKLGTCFTVYPDMKLKDNSIKQNFFKALMFCFRQATLRQKSIPLCMFFTGTGEMRTRCLMQETCRLGLDRLSEMLSQTVKLRI